jgi:NADH-quinone oxidoreductase subunit N
MNTLLLSHELLVLALGLLLLLADLWLPRGLRRHLGYAAAAGLAGILLFSFLAIRVAPGEVQYAFFEMYALDGLALFFKRFSLLAALMVLLMSVEFAESMPTGVSEYYALTLFALLGMLLASSANDFALLFVSLELITITFYVLASFHRSRMTSLEAGVKYLIIGALSTGFTVYGIALVYGLTGKLNFNELAAVSSSLGGNRLFLFGMVLILAGLGFKIAAVPFQIWAPDVYQGAPVPTTAFLAVGSKAAGFVLLLRVLFVAVPEVSFQWGSLLIVLSAITILYGNLCAIPQRNLKRCWAIPASPTPATSCWHRRPEPRRSIRRALLPRRLPLHPPGAFTVICLVMRQVEAKTSLRLPAWDNARPLAATLTLAMVSWRGSAAGGLLWASSSSSNRHRPGAAQPGIMAGLPPSGVVISLYYYFGVIRAIYWSRTRSRLLSIQPSAPIRAALYACMPACSTSACSPAPRHLTEEVVKVLR